MEATRNREFRALVSGAMVFLVVALGGRAVAQPCVQPPAGLVNWWPGDGSAEDIAGGNDGILNGSYGQGKVNQAFRFFNSGGVALGSGSSPSSFTIEAWVFANQIVSPNGYRTIYGDHIRGFWLRSGRINWWRAGDRFLGSSPLSTGAWHHIALTYAQGTFSGYLDGQPDGSSSAPAESLPTGPGLGIGSHLNTEPFDGLIDELSLYDRALSAGEIEDIFAAGSAGKCRIGPVDIDIKPGGDPNSINPRSKGLIPVAILTSDAFDATTVDPLSVAFGPEGAREAHGRGHIQDADGDGDADLGLHFRTADTGIQCGDTSAALTGVTFAGQPVEGVGSITTVACP